MVSAALGVGRVDLPAALCPAGIGGPTPVVIRDGLVLDASSLGPTVADLLDLPDLAARARAGDLPVVGEVAEVAEASHHDRRRADRASFLSPNDLQVVKAAGVTFATSLIERVIEEQAAGSPERALRLRETLAPRLAALGRMRAGSPDADAVRDALIAEGLWSAYLEVGLGPEAELFTKAPVLGSVGTGAKVGIRGDSRWNNPEPEVVLAVNARCEIVGAALGNDVNLRDVEGRSPLLLGEAKDNTASCAIGPWFTLFEPGGVTLDDVMRTSVSCEVTGDDGFRTSGTNDLGAISRDPRDLVRQATGTRHQYPDGLVLFLGTMYVPTADRDGVGEGFTHHVGDVVRIANPILGELVNTVDRCDDVPPWRDGIRELWRNLAARGLA